MSLTALGVWGCVLVCFFLLFVVTFFKNRYFVQHWIV